MPSKAVREKNFERNTNLIEAFCDENQVQFEKLNNGYQIRLEGTLDLYPVRGRWHNIKTGERGDWMGYKDLRRVMLMALEMLARPEPEVVVPPKDTYRLTQLTAEVVMIRWQYDSWLDRLLRRRTYYHRIRGKEWAFNSKRGWFKPEGKE